MTKRFTPEGSAKFNEDGDLEVVSPPFKEAGSYCVDAANELLHSIHGSSVSYPEKGPIRSVGIVDRLNNAQIMQDLEAVQDLPLDGSLGVEICEDYLRVALINHQAFIREAADVRPTSTVPHWDSFNDMNILGQGVHRYAGLNFIIGGTEPQTGYWSGEFTVPREVVGRHGLEFAQTSQGREWLHSEVVDTGILNYKKTEPGGLYLASPYCLHRATFDEKIEKRLVLRFSSALFQIDL